MNQVAETPIDTGPGPLDQAVSREWQGLLDKDDRTSPAEYPEMLLITRTELACAMVEGWEVGLGVGRREADERVVKEMEYANASRNLAAGFHKALTEARDLLLERTQGSPARSAAHNARLVIDAALAPK